MNTKKIEKPEGADEVYLGYLDIGKGFIYQNNLHIKISNHATTNVFRVSDNQICCFNSNDTVKEVGIHIEWWEV